MDRSAASAMLMADRAPALPRDEELVGMDARLRRRDSSLNHPVGPETDAAEAIDLLPSQDADPFHVAELASVTSFASSVLEEALGTLGARERTILEARTSDDPPTLEDLSRIHVVSRERIRQIQVAALARVARRIVPRHRASDLLAA